MNQNHKVLPKKSNELLASIL